MPIHFDIFSFSLLKRRQFLVFIFGIKRNVCNFVCMCVCVSRYREKLAKFGPFRVYVWA